LLDLYYARIHEAYTARSLTDLPKIISKLMDAYHFISQPPKREIELPRHGSKPLSKRKMTDKRWCNPIHFFKSLEERNILQVENSQSELMLSTL
jgi:hypothetical protein